MSEAKLFSAPRIYYFHPLLAGPLKEWGAELDRCSALGFDHILIPPLFATGRTDEIFLTGDVNRVHPALQWSGDAQSAIAHATNLCADRGLALLMDLVVDRVAEESPFPARSPMLFERPDEMAALDPRRAAGGFGAVRACWGERDNDEALASLWAEMVLGWASAGLSGVRILLPRSVPAEGVSALIQKCRARVPGFLFFGWMPARTGQSLVELRGSGLDFAFSSLHLWNFRDGRFWDELAALAEIALPVAAPEAPFGPRLAARWHDPATLRAAYLRALGCAATSAAGWLMPMGFEYGAARPLPRRYGSPEDLVAMRGEAHFDLGEIITGMNVARAEQNVFGSREPQLLSGPGDDIVAILHSCRREAHKSAITFVNTNLTLSHELQLSSFLPNIGAAFSGFCDKSRTWQAGDALPLAATETRIFQGVPASPVKTALKPRAAMIAAEAARIAIEAVSPVVPDGQFPVRRIVGESVRVEADVFSDGHHKLAVVLLWRAADERTWRETPMRPLENDRWQAALPLRRLGRHHFTIEAWHDEFSNFCDELLKKEAAGLSLTLEIEEGRLLIDRALERCRGRQRATLAALAARLAEGDERTQQRLFLDEATAALMRSVDNRPFRTRREPPFIVEAERNAAAFASWYELFPRSMSDDARRHGTFADVIRHLPRIRAMGFDVLYMPPIHPIGQTNRKGRNNAAHALSNDPGSPYAIGEGDGGHDAIHPELGTFADFRRLREAALDHGMELALDFAVQCSPDHPWLREHKGWFDWRPDGSLRYAENPPKKYEDIVNVDFYAVDAIPSLWIALRDVVLFWLAEGVRIFRVDNPHTKPLPFWEWLIAEVRAHDPAVIFLAEAFTRPKMMHRLAKIGFSQSYTYFTWRNNKTELEDYFTELNQSPVRDFFRPHLFVNTPDINPRFLQESGRAGFLIRAVLAATLSGLWGIYCGFELCEASALPGREEYKDSEKYQIRIWDWEREGKIDNEIARLNEIRRGNPALRANFGITFYNAFNDQILYYGKATPDRGNVIIIAVNLDPYHIQEADFELPLWEWNLPDSASLKIEDLMTRESYILHGKRQHLRLDPAVLPFFIWRISQVG